MNHIELGTSGENLAVNHLTTKGYEIVERNFRWKHSEIDIICEKDGLLVVVEVKTRNSNALGKPYQSVTIAKQRRVIKVANHYIQLYKREEEVRFDIVSIILNQNRMELEHIENAFYPLV
jgi:putative endonuclease